LEVVAETHEWEDVDSESAEQAEVEDLDNVEPKVELEMSKYKETLGIKANENTRKSYGFYNDFWKKNKVQNNGELLLEDGSVLGHKDYKLI